MVAYTSLALAFTVLTGFSSASVIQKRQGTVDNCAGACGIVQSSTQFVLLGR